VCVILATIMQALDTTIGQHRAAVYSRQRLASRHRHASRGRGTATVNVTTPAVPANADGHGADYFAWADGGQKLLPGLWRDFFREPLVPSLSNRQGRKERGDKKDDDKKTTDAKDWTRRTRTRKMPLRKKADAKKDERRIKTKTEKRRKEVKEQEKYVQEIAVALEFPRKKRRKAPILAARRDRGDNEGDEVLKNADILIENNRIRAGCKGSVPAGARVFDVAGKTVVPAC